MSYALELQDRALALARDGIVLSVAPSAAAIKRAAAGMLDEAELRTLLAAHSVQPGTPFWCVTSAATDPATLGTMLALAHRAGLAVAGFIDSATLCAAAAGVQRDALVIEAGLYHLAVTSIAVGRLIRHRRSIVTRDAGWMPLCEAWLDLIRSAMVNRTRFDPLRDAGAEQQLFDSLPALAQQAAEQGTAVAGVTVNGQTTQLPVTRDQLAQAAQPFARELMRLIAQLRMPGQPVDVIVPAEIASLPGIGAALDTFTSAPGEQLLVPEGFAAAAASLRATPELAQSGAVTFLRRIASTDDETLQALVRHRQAAIAITARRASHVLYQGQAFALRDGPIVVGRAGTEGNAILLPDHAAGVSRRHCSFVSNEDDVVLIDHSRYGTFVNGHRMTERTRIRAGDRVRIGDSGFELTVIAVDSSAVNSADAQA